MNDLTLLIYFVVVWLIIEIINKWNIKNDDRKVMDDIDKLDIPIDKKIELYNSHIRRRVRK